MGCFIYRPSSAEPRLEAILPSFLLTSVSTGMSQRESTEVPGVRATVLHGSLMWTREREKEACMYVGGGLVQGSFSFNSIFFPGPLVDGGLTIKSEEHALNW